MKKILSVVLVVIIMFSVAACGEKNYKAIDMEKIRTEYYDNAERAKKNCIGDYGFIELKVSCVFQEDQFLGEYGDSEYSYYYVMCELEDEGLQKKILTMNNGDKVEVKGKITGVKSWTSKKSVCIDMDVYEINFVD